MDLKVRETTQGITIECRVTPRAGRTAIKGIRDGVLCIALAAPPVEGKANDALCTFFAEFLSLPRSRIEILRGVRGRNKVLLLRDLDKEALIKALPTHNSVL